MKITKNLFPAIYKISKQVFDKTYTLTEAAKILSDEHGMNNNSAKDYINNFKYLMRGQQFKRTLNAPSMEFLIEQIKKDYGVEQYKKALTALGSHIQYCKSCHNGQLNELRTILERYSQ